MRTSWIFLLLKVVGNENQGGSGTWHTFGIGLGLWRSIFFLSFNLAVVFNLNVFPFPPSKPQFLGDVPMNGQDAANCSPPS